jgi:hypothetical protein
MPKKSGVTGELGRIPAPEGRFSTEISITVEDHRLNGGKPTNIPTLIKGQVDVDRLVLGEPVTDRQMEIAIQRAIERQKTGHRIPSYTSMEDAIDAAIARSRGKH